MGAGAVYTLEHNIKIFNFLSSNATKIVCQKNGTESVVFAMNDNGYNKMVLKNLFWVLFSIVAVIIVLFYTIGQNKKRPNNKQGGNYENLGNL